MNRLRKTTSLLLAACLLLGSLPLAAAGYIEGYFLNDILDEYVEQGKVYDTEYDGLTGSSAFASMVWLDIFGFDLGSTRAEILTGSSDYTRLGSFVYTNARPGDVLVFSGSHAVIVANAGKTGLTCYETPQDYSAEDAVNCVSKVTYLYDELATAHQGCSYYLVQMNDEVYSYVDNAYDGLSAPALGLPVGKEYTDKIAADEDSATLAVRVRTLPNLPLSRLGVEVWTNANQVVSSGFSAKAEDYSDGGFYYHAVFDTDKDLGLDLDADTTYKYRFFATIGQAHYYSEYFTIKTQADTAAPAQYTITLDPAGGKVSPAKAAATAGAPVGQLPTPTRSGYTFAGWHTKEQGGQKITSTDTYIWDKDITLYAQWTTQGVTIYFDAGDGDVYPESIQVAKGKKVGDLPVPVLKGATFAGWYTKEKGGQKVTAKTVFTRETSITLYARWSDENITVTFNATKGKVYPSSMQVQSEGRFDQLPTPTRSGYTFAGWYTEKRGGYKVAAGSKVWFDDDFTLYAHWNCRHNYKNGKCNQCGDYDHSFKGHKHRRGMHNFGHCRDYKDNRFYDVPTTSWYYDTVSKAYTLGLIDGMSLTSFEPDGTLTYAQAIKLAAGLHNIYYNGSAQFAQTSPWYKAYVDYALYNGIIDDDDYDDFNDDITRAEFVALLAAALPEEALEQINSVADYALPDVEMDHAYAPFIYRLYRAGVLTGTDEYGTFMPDTCIKRCEVASIIARMADTGLRQKIKLK